MNGPFNNATVKIIKSFLSFFRSVDLSKDCKNIVLNLFKFFQFEKARGRPFYSPDNLIKRTCKAAGISYSSVYRVVNGKSPPESNRQILKFKNGVSKYVCTRVSVSIKVRFTWLLPLVSLLPPLFWR
jgi:hypothetical protein